MNDTTYRYAVDADGTITRGSIERIGNEDMWRWFFEDSDIVGFYEEYARGRRPLTDSDECERAISAYQSAKNHGLDPHEALDTLAVRIGVEESTFIVVNLDRGTDLYVHSWSGANDEWHDEIEALWNHEVYRINAEQQVVSLSNGEPVWLSMDSDCTDYYGEHNAEAELARQFDLDEYPAEVLVGSDGS